MSEEHDQLQFLDRHTLIHVMSRRLLLLVCLAVTHAASPQQTATKENQTQNKTKRGLTEQTHTFHDVESFKPLILYPELAAAAGSHSDVYASPSAALATFENEPPKQVTAQQVLYEYQQTPSTTISNVHVNQQFQTVPTAETANSHVVYASQLPPTNEGLNLEAQQNQQSLSVHNVVHPVQHSSLIKHGQNYGQISYQPSEQAPRSPVVYPTTRNQQHSASAPPSPAPVNHQYVSHSVQPTQGSFYGTTHQHFPQQQQQPSQQQQQQQHHQQQQQQQHQHQQQNPFAQGKYLYVNGKILYYPQGIPTTPVVPAASYPGTIARHPVISYQNHPQKPLVSAPKPQKRPVAPTPTPTVSSVQYYNSYLPKKIIPTTTKAPVQVPVQAPAPAPVKETPREEKEEEEEEEPEEKPQLRPVEEEDEEEEEEDERPIRYHNQEEEDDEEEEEEELPTKYVPKYYKSKYLYSPSKDELDEYDDVDDDSDREPSKQVKQKTKTPKKYYKGDVYLKPTKEKNGYKNSKYFVFFDPLKEDPKKTAYVPSDSEAKHTRSYSSYKKPQKKSKARKSKVASSDDFEEPQMEYSVYKYHKVEPRKEDLLEREIEGRYSENVPVIHTQKVIKKQWLVTKTDSR